MSEYIKVNENQFNGVRSQFTGYKTRLHLDSMWNELTDLRKEQPKLEDKIKDLEERNNRQGQIISNGRNQFEELKTLRNHLNDKVSMLEKELEELKSNDLYTTNQTLNSTIRRQIQEIDRLTEMKSHVVSANQRLLKSDYDLNIKINKLENQLKEHAEVCKELANPLYSFAEQFNNSIKRLQTQIDMVESKHIDYGQRNAEIVCNIGIEVTDANEMIEAIKESLEGAFVRIETLAGDNSKLDARFVRSLERMSKLEDRLLAIQERQPIMNNYVNVVATDGIANYKNGELKLAFGVLPEEPMAEFGKVAEAVKPAKRYSEGGDAFQTSEQFGTECFGVIKGIAITHGGDQVLIDWYSPHDQTQEPVKRDTTREPINQFDRKMVNGKYRLYDRTAAYERRQADKLEAKIVAGAFVDIPTSDFKGYFVSEVDKGKDLFVLGWYNGRNNTLPYSYNDVARFVREGSWIII